MSTSAASYDDGSRSIPVGASGAVERVVVIGSGLAGLAAANALTHSGVETVVLEARDRLGGRTHTYDFGELPIDLGASWIHSPGGNPLTHLSDQLGLQRVSGDFRRDMVFLEPGRGRVSPSEEGVARDLADRVIDDIVSLGRGVDPTTAMDRLVAERVSKLDLPERITDLVTRRLRMWVEAEGAASWEDVAYSTVAQPSDPSYEGDDIGDLIVGGYRRVVEALGFGLDVKLRSPVVEIESFPNAVRVHTGTGTTEDASHVVVTVPLGVLKAGSIGFSPRLPEAKQASIDRLGFGRFEKVVVRFETSFWSEQGVPHVSVFDEGPEFKAIFGMDNAFPGQAVVVAFAFGDIGVMTGTCLDERVSRVVALLEEATGVVASGVVDAVTTDWTADPWTLGAYTYIRSGQSHRDVVEVAEPVAGRVLFAGEATSSGRAGFADGALSTGIREAKRLLSVAEVELGPL